MTTALTDNSGDVGMAVSMVGRQPRVAVSFFQGIEVGALHVFDNGNFKCFPIIRLKDQDWDFMMAGPLSRAPATFASDDFVSINDARDGSNKNGLNNSALPNRSSEFVEVRLRESLPRVAWVRAQEFDWRLSDAARPINEDLVITAGAEQRGEAPAKSWSLIMGTGDRLRALEFLVFRANGTQQGESSPTPLALYNFGC